MGAVGNSMRGMSHWIVLDQRHYYTAMKTSEYSEGARSRESDEKVVELISS